MRKKDRLKLGRPPRTDSIHRQIAETLRERIAKGEWPIRSVIPSFMALAKEFRTGESAIRLALNSLKSEGWIVPNPRRRLLAAKPEKSATTTSGIVLQIVGDRMSVALKDSVRSEIHRGIALGVDRLDAPLLIAHGSRLENALPEDLLRLPVRGIVALWPILVEAFPLYERLHVPVILIDRPDPRWRRHAVSVNNEGAYSQGVKRLIALGHRDIAFLSYMVLWKSELDPDSKERRDGFLKAVKEAGIWRRSGCVFNASDFDSISSAPLQAIVRATPPFTAVLTADPKLARLVLKVAQDAGLQVPRDLSVACLQGKTPVEPRIGGPRVDFAEMGRRSVLLLNEPSAPPIHLRVAAEWVDAQTVGPRRIRA